MLLFCNFFLSKRKKLTPSFVKRKNILKKSFQQKTNLLGYGSNAVLIGFLLAVFSTILGHSIFSWCLKYFSPSFVSASKLCEPVAAAVLAAFLFGEIPAFLQIIGGVLTLTGVAYYSKLERQNE